MRILADGISQESWIAETLLIDTSLWLELYVLFGQLHP